jgi:hypothetical protein
MQLWPTLYPTYGTCTATLYIEIRTQIKWRSEVLPKQCGHVAGAASYQRHAARPHALFLVYTSTHFAGPSVHATVSTAAKHTHAVPYRQLLRAACSHATVLQCGVDAMATACKARSTAKSAVRCSNGTRPHRRCPTTPIGCRLAARANGPAGGAVVLPFPFAKQEQPSASALPPAKATCATPPHCTHGPPGVVASWSHVSQPAPESPARQVLPGPAHVPSVLPMRLCP